MSELPLDASQPDGSALCLPCGFCCRGVLHLHASLDEDEVLLAGELGLEAAPHFDRRSFRLPCPRFEEGKCSTYQHRPRVCARYECRLLHRYLQGQIALEAALKLIYEADAQLAGVEASIGAGAAGKPLWQQLEVWCVEARRGGGSGLQSAESLSRIVSLAAHLQRHFERRHMANPMYAYVYWTAVSQLVPQETLETVVGKAVIEPEFRQALRADPALALAPYDLPEEAHIYLRAALDAAALDSATPSSTVAAALARTLEAQSGMHPSTDG
jgi:hypothetical protein